MMRIFSVFVPALLIVFGGCSPKLPTCVREHAQQQVIRWGEVRSNAITGYQVTARAELFAVQQASPQAQPVLEPKGSVENDLYCDRLNMVRHAFLDVQALNVPGQTQRFVEFSNPANGLELRATWNPEYETTGNAQFRAVYDSLETMRRTAE